jgi:hypothetical protein
MYSKRKERLYLSDIVSQPAITYPSYYTVSKALYENEFLRDALVALHMVDFSYYHIPDSADEIFKSLASGAFVIYKEQYVVGYFGGRLMYLEPTGWKSLVATQESFKMENWLV